MLCKKHSSLIMAAVLLLTLISLSTIIPSLAEWDISIDCGATGSYVDSDNKVKWVGDKGFVTTGESFKFLNNVPKPFKSLRYFPKSQDNCYNNIPAKQNRKTLVRTEFFYGNYDNKSSPPSFSVLYDHKYRLDPVNVSALSLELIFTPASENISVCLVSMSPREIPFISSIEVYSLDAGMYDDLGPDECLLNQGRFAFGAKEPIRYSLDTYGRQWSPLRSNESTITELKTAAPSINISGASNKPPKIVMLKAWSNASLTIPVGDLGNLPLKSLPVYLALYFSEPQSIGRTQTRSFNISLDSTQVGSGPIRPMLGEVIQFVVRDVNATSKSKLLVQSTKDSTLPPIINALEVYLICKSRGGQIGSSDIGWEGKDRPGKKKPKERPTVGPLDEATAKVKFTEAMKYKKPLILGITLPTAAALVAACTTFFVRKRSNAKPNTLPTTSKGNETGTSPLVGQQLASDA